MSRSAFFHMIDKLISNSSSAQYVTPPWFNPFRYVLSVANMSSLAAKEAYRRFKSMLIREGLRGVSKSYTSKRHLVSKLRFRSTVTLHLGH